MTYPLHITDIPYATTSRLNTLDICLPRPLEDSPRDAFWVVYVHGGAWRDPLIAASSIRPTIDHLINTNSPVLAKIAGFASVNYRLSPYPQHPTHPTRLDAASVEAALEGRSVAHPAHRNDVAGALRWLHDVYSVGDVWNKSGRGRNYALVGHSCGATLVLQVLPHLRTESLPQPIAVAGISGMYNVPVFAHNHADIPVYGEILAGAFGGGPIDADMEAAWDEASPVRLLECGDSEGLPRLLLAQSRADELVEWEQVEVMTKAVKEAGSEWLVDVLEITGHHDECWQKGEGVARVIEEVFKDL